ncbi:MAG: tetratricopeptide repeat protein [Winogradskyella sp.]|nr:MAG: tetratricopeptide repeat protein [Winogradskyella sp.]
MQMNLKKALFLIFFLVFISPVTSQNKVIDSLKSELQNHKKNDSLRVNLLNELANNYYIHNFTIAQSYLSEAEAIVKTIDYKKGEARSLYVKGALQLMKGDFESTIHYYQHALQLYNSIDFKEGVSECYVALGIISRYQNDYKKSIEYLEKAVRIKEEIGDTKEVPDDLNLLGSYNSIIGNYSESLKYQNKALKLFEEQNDENGMSRCFESIGSVYQRLGNYPLALKYLSKSLFLKEKYNDSLGISNVLDNIGLIHEKQGYTDKSLQYYNRALTINNKNNHKRGVIKTNIYIGNLFKNKKKYTTALTFLNRALEVSKEINDLENIAASLNYMGLIYLSQEKLSLAHECYKKSERISLENGNQPTLSNSYLGLGNTYLGKKKYKKALFYALKSKEIGKKLNSLSNQSSAEYLLFNIYKKTQDYKKALSSHEEYKRVSDSLFNKENIRKITQLEYEYKYKQERDSASIRELKLTKTVQATSQDLEKTQRNYLWSIIGVLLLSILLGAIMFYQKLKNAKSKTQNAVMEQKLLRSQMTPHFIFNSLSVLQGMILNKEEKKSVHYLSKFSKLLRITLENSRDKLVLLSQELTAVQDYLALQNLENDTYKFTILVEDTIDVPSFEIPPMLIQPFVENAIEHAFVNKTEDKRIDINLFHKDRKLICTIADNGVGINFKTQSNNNNKKSLATTITSERLKVISKDFKMQGSVTIEDKQKFNEQGTLVTLVIPYKINAA